ncbi:MAG: hypothetical protein AUH81_12005 [Candidatus Rokubacteria bacterium 13_1_40CM_4_69_5]|nr:MAG: hypothetical protein AUH81_12005 [Candidatus Rokubacteria bacterium 13_1_40CM_4_69_5]
MAFWWPPRFFRPRRTIRPTREGWWCLLVAVGLGFTAVNSGNNMLYLLESMLLGLIIISGILSEQSMRHLQLSALVPDEIYAERPAMLGATVVNARRRLPARSIVLEILDGGRVIYLPRLAAGAERVVAWRLRIRGGALADDMGAISVPTPLARLQYTVESEVVVYPAVGPVALDRLGASAGAAASALRRRGRGQDLHNLREYRDGDDPRLIHWRVSAKTGVTTVRELEAEAAGDVRLVLRGTGARDPVRLERGLSEAASLAGHFIRQGAAVSLGGPGLSVRRGRGREHERQLLTALALYAPPSPGPAPAPGDVREPEGPMREIAVDLD